MEIRISGLIDESIVDGPGIRLIVFTQGCNFNCENCHNPQTHDINGGRIIDCDEIIKNFSSNPILDGITFSGGEPFLQPEECAYIARQAQAIGLSVITYTGYTFEKLYLLGNENSNIMLLLENTDILIDGKFDKNKRNIYLKFKGSENQRTINIKETLKSYERNNAVILLNEEK